MMDPVSIMINSSKILVGAIMRRWWGGWCAPTNLVKRIVVVLVAFAVGYFSYSAIWPTLLVTVGTIFCFLMPKHGYGIAMGKDPKHPLWACLLVMFLQYGVTSIALWAALHFGFNKLYLPLGIFVPLVYFISSRVWKPEWTFGEYPKGNVFIDGSGAISELFLGATLIYSIYG